jgi:hypothetical protein
MTSAAAVPDSLSIQVVACVFRMAPNDYARRLSSLLDRLRVPHRGVIASSLISEPHVIDDRWSTLSAPNDDLDFSSYFVGARAINEASNSTVTLFVNDSLFTNHAPLANLRALLRLAPLVAQLPIPALSGKCDPYTTISLRNPWSELTQYVSTYCFLLNGPGLQTFLMLPALAEADGVTLQDNVGSPTWGAGLPPFFREFIKSNLLYRESPYLWYRLRDGQFDDRLLRGKARCIYFEHRLSGAIADAGCLLPTNAGPRWATYLRVAEHVHRIASRWLG